MSSKWELEENIKIFLKTIVAISSKLNEKSTIILITQNTEICFFNA